MKLRLDLHAHPFEALRYPEVEPTVVQKICQEAQNKGLDGLAVTEHDSPSLGFRAREMADRQGMGLLIIPGQEIKIKGHHVVELYMFGRCARILVHPVDLPPDDLRIDAVEIASVKGRFDSPKVMEYVNRRGMLVVSNSDAHYLSELGAYSTLLNLEDLFFRQR